MLRSPPRCSQTKPVCRAEVGGQKLPATEYLGRRKHSAPSTRVQRHPAQASSVSVPMVFRRSAGARPGLRRQFFGASRPVVGGAMSAGRRQHRGTSSTGCRSEEHTSELQSRGHLVCRLLLEKKKGTLCGAR